MATNTSLGAILLLAPLAMVPPDQSLDAGVQQVLEQLSADDCRRVYEAIRLAEPGGLGKVDQADISESPPEDLLYAMRLAGDRDLVARQYVNGFEQVLDELACWLSEGLQRQWPLAEVIVHAQLRLMSRYPDSLIARKCGPQLAARAAAWAGNVLESGEPGDEAYRRAVVDFDFWLRCDHHRRNPGTSADLTAAGLFCACAMA